VVGSTITRLFTFAQALRRPGNGYCSSRSLSEEAVSLADCVELTNRKYQHAPKTLRAQIARSIYKRTRSLYYINQCQGSVARLHDVRWQQSPKAGERQRPPGGDHRRGQALLGEAKNLPSVVTNTDQQVSDPDVVDLAQGFRNSSLEDHISYPPMAKSPGISSVIPCPICFTPLNALSLTESGWRYVWPLSIIPE
jgi:hypothetical protein